MTDEMKAEIRSRMSEVSHIYRGNDLPELVTELSGGRVDGATHRVWTVEEPIVRPEDVEGREVDDIPLMQPTEVGVTGGFSDSLAQTHSFNGAENTSLVLKASEVDVSPIKYDYNYYNQNPGVYAHVRSSIGAELRHETRALNEPSLGSLVGFTKTGPRSARDTTIVEEVETVELDGNSLPGTSNNSLIARESEWVSHSSEVSLSNAVEGVVTINEGVGVRVTYAQGMDIIPKDAPPVGEIVEEVYQDINQNIPDGVTHYLLVVDSIGDAADRDPEAYPVEVIDHAVGPNGEKIPASSVPDAFRGVNRP